MQAVVVMPERAPNNTVETPQADINFGSSSFDNKQKGTEVDGTKGERQNLDPMTLVVDAPK